MFYRELTEWRMYSQSILLLLLLLSLLLLLTNCGVFTLSLSAVSFSSI